MEESYRENCCLWHCFSVLVEYKAKVSVENCRKTPDANVTETGIAVRPVLLAMPKGSSKCFLEYFEYL